MSGWIFENKVFCGIVRVVRERAYYAGSQSPTRFKLFSSDKSKPDNAGKGADATLSVMFSTFASARLHEELRVLFENGPVEWLFPLSLSRKDLWSKLS